MNLELMYLKCIQRGGQVSRILVQLVKLREYLRIIDGKGCFIYIYEYWKFLAKAVWVISHHNKDSIDPPCHRRILNITFMGCPRLLLPRRQTDYYDIQFILFLQKEKRRYCHNSKC